MLIKLNTSSRSAKKLLSDDAVDVIFFQRVPSMNAAAPWWSAMAKSRRWDRLDVTSMQTCRPAILYLDHFFSPCCAAWLQRGG
jgi:hypothetical protein